MSRLDIPRVEFIYLRHGQTDWNLQDLVQGISDIPLNETGRQQARNASDAMKELPIKSVYASPRKRAFETAEIIAVPHNIPVRADDDLREPDFGSLEGQKDDGLYHAWRKGEISYEGGDSYQDQLKWIKRGLIHSLENAQEIKANGLPMIVAHGGVFWALRDILGLSGNEDLKNASPIRIFPVNDTSWDFEYIPI
ncbi:histidine phosphatase family protein [Curvivirga aplysinae]|uniref:histidine phosphatase family protein n=1 Tax=Curvivirga aplysinae TaxID=2529852 RepID=UPI0012BC452E|nr:histidine phosphatase family protein [Curvivirga aplysinae]